MASTLAAAAVAAAGGGGGIAPISSSPLFLTGAEGAADERGLVPTS